MESKGTRIGVVVRVRPLLSKELKSGQINSKIDLNWKGKTPYPLNKFKKPNITLTTTRTKTEAVAETEKKQK